MIDLLGRFFIYACLFLRILNVSPQDVWQIQAVQRQTQAKSKLIADAKKREFEDRIAEKIKNAQAHAPKSDVLPDTKRIAAIRKNRQQAQDQERQTTSSLRNSNVERKPADVIPLGQQSEDFSYPDFVEELFGDD
ncbi:MAG: hypothetical protein ACXWTY_00730 [Methylobacter sp.]